MRQASRRKYHYIYKTTCLVTGKYYLGMHSTDDLNDGYIGSGSRLRLSVNKHGKENHICEIQEHYFTREWLKEREAELVCAETLTDPKCMNLALGGGGGLGNGWKFVHTQRTDAEWKDIRAKGGAAANKVRTQKLLEKHKDPNWLATFKNNVSAARKKFAKENNNPQLGSTRSDATKEKMSESKKGAKNNQFGTCWIYSLSEKKSIKIKKDELQSYVSLGWCAGRKLKF